LIKDNQFAGQKWGKSGANGISTFGRYSSVCAGRKVVSWCECFQLQGLSSQDPEIPQIGQCDGWLKALRKERKVARASCCHLIDSLSHINLAAIGRQIFSPCI